MHPECLKRASPTPNLIFHEVGKGWVSQSKAARGCMANMIIQASEWNFGQVSVIS